MSTDEAVERWGLYASGPLDSVRILAISGPTTMHPSWWPATWEPLHGVSLFRTSTHWDHKPTDGEVGDALKGTIP